MVKTRSEYATPLFVDTDIEYQLDMTLFPGWSNPIARMQPSLMIHREGCSCQTAAIDELHNLIESCQDLECSETDSFLDEIIDDVDESDSVMCSSLLQCSDIYPLSPQSSDGSTDNFQLDEILKGIIPISNTVTPDLTSSLLSVEEKSRESTALSDSSGESKGVKRRLFSCDEDENNNIPPAKRHHEYISDEDAFSILDDLFNHIQGNH